jgi:hypothetical protein
MGDARHLRQGFAQQRRFIAIAGRRKRRSYRLSFSCGR